MGAAAINSSKAAFIIRILVESLQHRQDPRVLQIRRLLEAGFTGMRTDKRGVKRYYRDGRQIANPTAAEKKAVTNRGQRAVAKHLRISHDEAKSRISAIGPDTPPEHIKALANDLMNLSYKDLIRIKQDLGARGGWGSKAKMTDRLQQGVTRNELPTATRSGLQAVRVQRSADGKGLEIDPTGQSNRIAWQTPDGKLHSTAIGAYGHLKQNKHLVEPAKADEPAQPQEPAGETPGSATEPAPTPAAPEAPAEKPKAKRKRKSRAKMTILGIVAKQGGINPQSVKAMANYKEQIVEGGLLHAIRKNGIDIGKMAESLERQGHFRTPPDRHADDYLLELMAKRSYSQLAEEHYNLDKEQEEYYKALEDAQGEHNEREVAAARGRGEEAGRKEGENSSVSEVSGWDQPDEEGTGGAEEDDYDRNEPAGQELDTSFEFGANAEEPQEPDAPKNSKNSEGAKWEIKPQFQQASSTPTLNEKDFDSSGNLIVGSIAGFPITTDYRDTTDKISAKTKSQLEKELSDPEVIQALNDAGIHTLHMVRDDASFMKKNWTMAHARGKLLFNRLSAERIAKQDNIRSQHQDPLNPRGIRGVIFHEAGHGLFDKAGKEKQKEFTSALKEHPEVKEFIASRQNIKPPMERFDDMNPEEYEAREVHAELHAIKHFDPERFDKFPAKIKSLVNSIAGEKDSQQPTPGFTGIDAQGREWRNGELVAKQEEPAGAKPATDLFGNPLPANQPKEPETMPGLFGERVPVAPDKPQAAPSQPEPMPGTDNPLDRPDAAKKDDTQDMFGLFGPGSQQAAQEESPEDAPTSPAAVADQDQPGDTPRTKAARVSAALDADYENARASAVPNMGADIKGSARHKAMAWKGLKDAEANGTAEAMVRRDELLKHEPSNLSTILNKTNFLGVLTSQLIMQAFPKEVHGYGKYTRDTKSHVSTPENLRAQYYEAFTDIKKLTEDLAVKGADPKEITAELKIKVSNLIDKFRKKGEGQAAGKDLKTGGVYRLDADRYNPVANSLADMYNRLSKRGSTSVLGRVSDFGQRLMVATKNQDPSMETVNKAVSAVADILEGKSFNQAFDTVEKKKAGFDYNEAYGGEVVRKGGKSINMNEQSLSRPGSKVFMDDMQMRGVQFGNSLPDAERIYHSQKSAEALSDLTEILGFPSYAASLGGSLGLAIGARGRGGARAHFEPWQADDKSNPNVGGPVINLTRANGAGSLAHEWGHGLDYFAANNSPGETKFLSQGRGSPKTIEAMKKVQEAMASSGFMDRMYDATVALDPVERSYWNSSKEKFARTFERYVQNKLHDADRENTYLTGLHKATHPYWPNNQEMDHIEPFMDALMTAIAAEKFPDHTMPEIASKKKKQRPKDPEKPKQSTKPTFIRFGTKPPPGGWKDSDRVMPSELYKKVGPYWTGTDEKGNKWVNGQFAGEEGTYKEAVMPTDHAAKIKLIQSIIAQTGATPPKPKQAQEAEQDPRVQRIRELLGQRC